MGDSKVEAAITDPKHLTQSVIKNHTNKKKKKKKKGIGGGRGERKTVVYEVKADVGL